VEPLAEEVSELAAALILKPPSLSCAKSTSSPRALKYLPPMMNTRPTLPLADLLPLLLAGPRLLLGMCWLPLPLPLLPLSFKPEFPPLLLPLLLLLLLLLPLPASLTLQAFSCCARPTCPSSPLLGCTSSVRDLGKVCALCTQSAGPASQAGRVAFTMMASRAFLVLSDSLLMLQELLLGGLVGAGKGAEGGSWCSRGAAWSVQVREC